MADKYLDILRKYWGYEDFRGIQREIIESIGSGRDTLGLMPTGGGKSITFQVPALAQEGVCLVITPLIALMKDQVSHLRQRGIRAAAIHSDMTHSAILQALDNCVYGGTQILYVSPERLHSELFQAKFRHMKISFITVDEAHCISQWGYDFRPSYLHIAEIRQLKPEIPVLALTATATKEVVEDIQEQLRFKEKNVFRMSFERKNLAYVVRKATDKPSELRHILNSVNGSAIVYARSRKRTKETAEWLVSQGISATYYHAGLDVDVKDRHQQAWVNNEKRVMVATNAFGMGIDKPDVRLVIHIDSPDSLEAYFQEAGRAGRDGKKAYAVLLYDSSDARKLSKRVSQTYPEKEYIRDVYEHLAYFFQVGTGTGRGRTFEFSIDKFCVTYKYFPVLVNSALQILERSGYIHYEADPDNSARILFLLERNDLYFLENTTKETEAVITALLRLYGGLFTDYVYIDEGFVANEAGLTQPQVYMVLKELSKRHIVDFIPRRRIPYITYTREREDGDRVIIPQSVYEERRAQYIKRIQAMLDYANNDHVCRSRQLLDYFGEECWKDCRQCDVCVTHQGDMLNENRVRLYRQQIKELLGDRKKHHIAELHTLNIPTECLNEALEELISEKEIHYESPYLYI
ncbi:MAG TPA: RecQ family ATP-dependent DNA helicase [Candidatus Prevotella avicola]|uniref:ATP-dependent DNA helicase RecQ n=1 Tax=Candidatus Prevotella avicola TaxID=2838738 RepID=A0A9D2FY82_9BACT|nr:RecQ family ATP-dependent DNA helicase [Candidatus Prevotella avicola]